MSKRSTQAQRLAGEVAQATGVTVEIRFERVRTLGATDAARRVPEMTFGAGTQPVPRPPWSGGCATVSAKFGECLVVPHARSPTIE
jgi:hypothetical protein